jgi:hypothetical protein
VTSRSFERFCPALQELLENLWPQHPPLWWVTDHGRHLSGPRTVRVNSSSWVFRLREGVREIRRQYPAAVSVMVMLEEKFPLYPFSPARVTHIMETAQEHRLDHVAFIAGGYCPVSWKREVIGGVRFYRTPQDFQYYSQNSVGVWSISHLLDQLRYALAHGRHDGWAFERIARGRHYVSAYPWPNLAGGLFSRGWVQEEGLRLIAQPEGSRVARMLLKEYIRQQQGDAFARKKSREEMCDVMPSLKLLGTATGCGVMALLKRRALTETQLADSLGDRRGVRRCLREFCRAGLLVRCAPARFRHNPDPDGNFEYARVLALAQELL